MALFPHCVLCTYVRTNELSDSDSTIPIFSCPVGRLSFLMSAYWDPCNKSSGKCFSLVLSNRPFPISM